MALVGSGVVGLGRAEFLDVGLSAGVTYSVYVEADEPNVDFDLKIFDQNGNLVAIDDRPSADAHCLITPA